MAKVEQFPDQTGENGITENVKDQKTREIFDSGRRRGNSSMPDDSLLMGSSTGQNPAREPAGRKAEKDNDLTYKDQIKKHRERIRIYRIFGAVIAVIAVLLTVLFFTTRHFNRAEIAKVRDFPAEEGAVCVNFDGHVLQYGPNGATCADTNGRARWSITYEMDQPIVSMSGDKAAIADYGGTSIYVMSAKKQLYTVNTSIPIHKISVSECGEVAAILNDSSKSWLATVLLCFFLGYLGIHRFYVGKTGTGILQLITGGGCGIWALIDFIIICIGSFTDGEGKTIRNDN
jgi:TM2 domain-containing membrane protein YozV